MDGPRVVCQKLRTRLHESVVRSRFETCSRRSALQFANKAEAGEAIAPILSFRTTSGPVAVLDGCHDCPDGASPVEPVLFVESRVLA